MDMTEKAILLKSMLSQISPEGAIESLSRPKSGSGLSTRLEGQCMPEQEESVDSALRKMAENRTHEVTPSELNVLEAIVMPTQRPVVFIRGNSYENVEAPWTALNDKRVRARIDPLLPLIGRIEVPDSPLVPYAGTGFVVGKNLLMTNRHVAALFAQGVGLRIRCQEGDAADRKSVV